MPAQYLPGVTYNISVRIQDATKLGAGFQADAVAAGSGLHAGTLIATDLANTQLNPGDPNYVNHRSLGVSNSVANWNAMGRSATYQFAWKAPNINVGAVQMYAAGNAINNNGDFTGDVIYLTNVVSLGTPTGACCDDGLGDCVENLEQANCEGMGFRYGGDHSTCGTINPPCVGPPPTGACCDDDTGNCTEDILQADCQAAGDRWGGANSTCALIDPPCLPPIPTGACCDGTTGRCTDGVEEASCVGDQRSWFEDQVCASLNPPCSEHTGACCDLLAGACEDDVPGSACVGTHSIWTKAALCGDVACDAVIGACCDHDPFGACTDGLTQAGCDCASCEWSEGGLCAELDCVHQTIPAVGEWGIGILTLLLLTGAKIVFRAPPTAGPGREGDRPRV